MSCDATKFVISKGVDNTFTFTIKQDNSTLPLTIVEGTDTFFADLILLDGDVQYPRINNKALVVENAANGKVSLAITADETLDETGAGGIIGLITDKATKVDRYYLRPTYKLLLKCVTVNNGEFVARVDEVYVN